MSCNKGEDCKTTCPTGADCDKDAKIRLHYFNARGRAELVRYILAFAKRDFEDVRYTKEEWATKKAGMTKEGCKCTAGCDKPCCCCQFPTGQLPVLEIQKGGKSYYLTQSVTIARSLANKSCLAGENEIERTRCDEVIDCLDDLIKLAVMTFFEQDPERKEKIKNRLRDEEYPRLLGYLERKLKCNGGKHIVGNKWTWADFAIANFIDGMVKRGADEAKVLEKLPGLSGLAKSVNEIPEIAAWIAKRPATEM